MSEHQGRHDDRAVAGKEQSGCCGGGKPEAEAEAQAAPRKDERKDPAPRRGCCG